MPLATLTSLDNPRIKTVVKLREQRNRRQSGLLVAEGVRQVERAIESGLKMHDGFVCTAVVKAADHDSVEAMLSVADQAGAAAQWFDVNEPLMRKMAYRQNPQGVLAVFEQPSWDLAALQKGGETGAPLWLVAVGTTKPGNLGAMVRSAEAAGAWGVLVADGVVDAFNPNAIQASTGAVFTLPVVSLDTRMILLFLSAGAVQLVVATPGACACYAQVDLTRPTALVIGAEDRGLASPWVVGSPQPRRSGSSAAPQLPRGLAVHRVSIPSRGRTVDSLNASAAAAVLLFEAVRQRDIHGTAEGSGTGGGSGGSGGSGQVM